MAIQFKIKKGLKDNLPKVGELGCWYLTTDTHELFTCLNGDEGDLTLHKVNDIETFDPTEINNRITELDNRVSSVETRVDNLQLESGVVRVTTIYDLPGVGDPNVVYVVVDQNAIYRWDSEGDSSNNHYICIGRDFESIQSIDGGNAE